MSDAPPAGALEPQLAAEDPPQTPTLLLSRRRFARIAGLAAASAALAPASAVAALSAPHAPRRLRFFNLHTGERLDAVYYENGGYVGQALGEINYILRDFRQNEIKPIHPQLLDLVVAIRRHLGVDGEVDVISGYRTPQTNAMLAARSHGVARHSLHMDAMALDFRVPGRTLEEVHRVAVAMRGGGVGYYPRSDFVHVDIGRVRYW